MKKMIPSFTEETVICLDYIFLDVLYTQAHAV